MARLIEMFHTTGRKIALVCACYVLATLLATAVVAIHVAATDHVQGEDGMRAFGEGFLFLAVLALASVPATGAGLYFLRGVPRFWLVFGALALAIAATGIAAALTYLTSFAVHSSPAPSIWVSLSPLRILVAPLFALVFLLAGLFAPGRPARITLLTACAVEALVFGVVALWWLGSFNVH